MKKSRLSSGRCRRVALAAKGDLLIEAAARLKSQSRISERLPVALLVGGHVTCYRLEIV